MSLFGALNIGRSALAAQQAALQVTGNNIANAGNADYSREVATLTPSADQQLGPGIYIGTGVNLADIQRQVDAALTARLNSSASDNQAATTSQQYLSQVESSFSALGTRNISTSLSTFFTDWSNLASNPQDAGARQTVLVDGASLASSFTNQRTQLGGVQSNVQTQLANDAQTANTLAQQVADLNAQIVTRQGGAAGGDNSLQDQRDAVLKKLSGLVNIQTVDQGDGSVNVYVGSEPLVIAGKSSGISSKQQIVNGSTQTSLTFTNNGGPLNATSGELAALVGLQTQIAGVGAQVDTLAHDLIATVNNIHASGQGTEGFSTVTATNSVTDPTAALNSAAAGLKFPPTNGSFVVHVTDKATGVSTSTLVNVSLTGAPTDTTLNSLAASLNGIGGVSATLSNGQLKISATSSGSTISFSQDSSNTLAGLGINTFFSGSDSSNISVNSALAANPNLIAAAKNGNAGDNQSALAIAALNTTKLTTLGGTSLQDNYQAIINDVAGQVSAANTNAQATSAVLQTLTTQQQALSGVSLDEESINMLQQQRAYQGAAVFLTTVNNMMTSLLAITT